MSVRFLVPGLRPVRRRLLSKVASLDRGRDRVFVVGVGMTEFQKVIKMTFSDTLLK